MSASSLRLDWATHDATTYAVTRWHYSRTMPAGKLMRVGVWEHGAFIGVVLFGGGANRNIGEEWNLRREQCAELVRVALTTHEAPVSRIVAIALRMVRKACPDLQVIVSYADEGKGHHGGIYQAGGWLYVGRYVGERTYWHGGKLVHSRTISGLIKSGTLQSTEGLRMVPASAKYKYVLPLTPQAHRRVAAMAKPYPKRARSIEGDAADDQSAQGGSSPTRALPGGTHTTTP